VVPKDSRDDNFNRASEDLSNYLVVHGGDVVVNKMKAWQGSIAVSQHTGIVSPAYFVFSFTRNVVPRFAHYLLRCDHYRQDFEKLSSGVRPNQWDLDVEAFGRLQAALPALPAQRAIANFLDRKTAAIDALIAKKERLVELLQEKRQALITQTVTRGLDPNVPLKNSGIEWLGSIPSHWKVFRTKHAMARIVDCPHETPEVSPDFTFPAVRTADVDRGRLLLDQAQRVSEETYRERTRRLVPEAGDILYSREGGRFGHAALVPAGVALCLGQRMMMFRARRVEHDPAYFMWVLNADCTFRQVTQDTLGSAAPRVNIPTVANAWVPCPPRAEQAAIAARIDRSLRHLDTLEAQISSSLARLREYRQALITVAVTGKIDVSKEAA
jgi:type I restriction enzyme S subunit